MSNKELCDFQSSISLMIQKIYDVYTVISLLSNTRHFRVSYCYDKNFFLRQFICLGSGHADSVYPTEPNRLIQIYGRWQLLAQRQ